MIGKAQLSDSQRAAIWERLAAPEHSSDVSPREVWNLPNHERDLVAVFNSESSALVGTVYCFVSIPFAHNLAWWIDAKWRHKGYWKDIADALADHLKARGVTQLGSISYRGNYYEASKRMGERLAAHFKYPPAERNTWTQSSDNL